jgi:ribosomal protein S18 acetylase RimI-like enzyme
VSASERALVAPAHPLRPAAITLRSIADDDLGFLSDLYALGRAEEMSQVDWPPEAKRAFLQHQFELQHAYYHANYPGADFLVVEHAEERIGRIYVYRSAGDIRLMDIALIPQQRGRGIGSALLAELIEESERTGASISLHVEADNPVQRLYQRLGFTFWEDRGVCQFLGRKPQGLASQRLS